MVLEIAKSIKSNMFVDILCWDFNMFIDSKTFLYFKSELLNTEAKAIADNQVLIWLSDCDLINKILPYSYKSFNLHWACIHRWTIRNYWLIIIRAYGMSKLEKLSIQHQGRCWRFSWKKSYFLWRGTLFIEFIWQFNRIFEWMSHYKT